MTQEGRKPSDRTVLVVDDDAGAAELITEILTGRDYNVVVAANGIEAIEKSNHGHIDLILMDIRMPYFSGIWFCDAFRKRKNTQNIPIVLVSGLLDEEYAAKARQAGANATLKKPFTCDELLRTVEKNIIQS